MGKRQSGFKVIGVFGFEGYLCRSFGGGGDEVLREERKRRTRMIRNCPLERASTGSSSNVCRLQQSPGQFLLSEFLENTSIFAQLPW